jgi:hypothetical protein
LNDEAFLDRETGLVWDRPGTINYSGSFPDAAWVGAVRVCYAKTIGMRQGWRPATMLAGLIGDFPPFPAGFLTGPVTTLPVQHHGRRRPGQGMGHGARGR